MKRIEEIAHKYVDWLYDGKDLENIKTKEARDDELVSCLAFGNTIMEQPLADRLTDFEKKEILRFYFPAGEINLDTINDMTDEAILKAISYLKLFETDKPQEQ